MLWRVTQTAVTLRTGLHSVPSIDAQICRPLEASQSANDLMNYMSIGINVLERTQRWSNGVSKSIHAPDVWVPYSSRLRQTALLVRRSGIGHQNGTSG